MSNDDELDVNGQKASRACLMYRAQCFVVAIAARLGPTSTWHACTEQRCVHSAAGGAHQRFPAREVSAHVCPLWTLRTGARAASMAMEGLRGIARSLSGVEVTVVTTGAQAPHTEVEAERRAADGLEADLVLMYHNAERETVAAEEIGAGGCCKSCFGDPRGVLARSGFRKGLGSEDRSRQRDDQLAKMSRAGLRLTFQPTKDGKSTLVKITAPLARLEAEAERLGLEMKLRSADEAAVYSPRAIAYADFCRSERDNFALKSGRLFSPRERQILIYSIIEAATWRGGAQLDLEDLAQQHLLSAHFPPHSFEVSSLHDEWVKVRCWPFAQRRLLPDLGLVQQPLSAVRDYYGEKIAFYFAWLEHYSCWLIILMWASIIVAGLSTHDAGGVIGIPVYGFLIAIWTTFHSESWKRHAAELRWRWNVGAFAEKEQPRPEFLHAFGAGYWRAVEHGGRGFMHRAKGFYAAGRRFISLESDDARTDAQREPRLADAFQKAQSVLVINWRRQLQVKLSPSLCSCLGMGRGLYSREQSTKGANASRR